MTKKEKREKAYELIDAANKLLDEVANAEPEVELEDPVAEYKDAVNATYDTVRFYVNDYGKLARSSPASFDSSLYNPYYQFLSREYADEAARLYKLICMQLAFRWCHDRDYAPDWADKGTEKWFVYYDANKRIYDAAYICSMKDDNVYFSSREIATECANWLNALDKEE